MPKQNEDFIYLCPECNQRGMTWDWKDETRTEVIISCSLCAIKKTIPVSELHDIRRRDDELGKMHRAVSRASSRKGR